MEIKGDYMRKKLDFNKGQSSSTINIKSNVIGVRMKPEIRLSFETFAILNKTTPQNILRDYIYSLLEIPSDDFTVNSICAVCGKTFLSNNTIRKFCSYECRKKNNLALRKAWEFKNRSKDENLLTPADVLEIKQEKYCFYCGCELNDSNRTIDHFIPLCKGGANVKENLVACCFGCNNKKGMKTYEEFMGMK